MKTRLTLVLVLVLTSIASAHPGHGDDPVHYAIGIDWPLALLLMIGGGATAYFARHTLVRVAGGIAACAGLIFATTLL